MNQLDSPDHPRTTPSVRISLHPVDWEQGDPTDPTLRWLSDLTFRSINALGQARRSGCHFITPAATVSSREPSADFFREALNQRGSWLREFRRAAGNRRQREAANILTVSARQSALSGVMLIGGETVPPQAWRARADEMMSTETVVLVTITRRKPDLAALKITGDPDPLKAVTLAELRVHLAGNPDAALYVAPGVTVSASTPSRAFLWEARKRADEWHGKLYHALRRHKKTLLQAVDLPTLMLAYCGTLVIHGQCFIPGCWPNENSTKARLNRMPFQGPTVPPEFLGLDHPSHSRPESLKCDQETASVDSRHDSPRT